MANVLKVLSTETTLSTANAESLSNATLVRLLNISNDTPVTITLQNANADANIASFTLNFAGTDESVVYLKKDASERILTSANTIVKAVPVAYY